MSARRVELRPTTGHQTTDHQMPSPPMLDRTTR